LALDIEAENCAFSNVTFSPQNKTLLLHFDQNPANRILPERLRIRLETPAAKGAGTLLDASDFIAQSVADGADLRLVRGAYEMPTQGLSDWSVRIKWESDTA